MRIVVSTFLTVILVTLLGCTTSKKLKAAKSCSLPAPVVLKDKGDTLFQYWELEGDSSDYELTAFQGNKLSNYQARLKGKLDTDAKSLMKNALKYEAKGDRNNIKLILSNPKKIRNINCLETELLDIQNKRVDLIDEPTEFVTFMLTKDESHRLYYFTSNIAGIRNLGFIHGQLERLISKGWILSYNLHNHNFFIESDKPRGGIAPSVTDSWLYQMELKEYGLKGARITNGFETVEIPANLIPQLSTSN